MWQAGFCTRSGRVLELHQEREGNLGKADSGGVAGAVAEVEGEALLRTIRHHLIRGNYMVRKGGGQDSGPAQWAVQQRGIWQVEEVGNKKCEEAAGGCGIPVITTISEDHQAGPALVLVLDLVRVLDMRAQASGRHLEDSMCVHT